MSYQKVGNIAIEDARLIFKNFSGKETRFTREGDKSFGVLIEDPKLAEQLVSDGWNVKPLKPRDPDDEPKQYLQVSVKYNDYPPKIYMITGKNRTLLDEDTVGAIDYADIKSVDLIIRPYTWEVNGKQGVKAYVKTMYVVIDEDEFEAKYTRDEDLDETY